MATMGTTALVLASQPSSAIVGLIDAGQDPDAKVYPGDMAVARNGDVRFSNGSVYNASSTAYATVELPIINDDLGRGISKSYVYVVDRNPVANITCRLNTLYWNNTHDQFYGYWGSSRSTVGSSGNQGTLTMGSATHGSTRHEFITCTLPPRYYGNASYIISYKIEE